MFHQFTNIVAEEKLLDKVGLLEDGAEDDVKGGEAAGPSIEGGVLVLPDSSSWTGQAAKPSEAITPIACFQPPDIWLNFFNY